MTSVVNRVVARGFGPSRGLPGRSGPISRGYGGTHVIVQQLAAASRRRINLGSSSRSRNAHLYEELGMVMVWAQLTSVDDSLPEGRIVGRQRVKTPPRSKVRIVAEMVAHRVRKAYEDIKISVKRIK